MGGNYSCKGHSYLLRHIYVGDRRVQPPTVWVNLSGSCDVALIHIIPWDDRGSVDRQLNPLLHHIDVALSFILVSWWLSIEDLLLVLEYFLLLW